MPSTWSSRSTASRGGRAGLTATILVLAACGGGDEGNGGAAGGGSGGGGGGAPDTFPNLSLSLVASGFTLPVDITQPAGDSSRLFVAEKAGRVLILENGTFRTTPWLDLTALVNVEHEERGLLGIAFHPEFASNGRFFVNFTGNADAVPGLAEGDTAIVEYRVSAGDPNVADPATQRVILTIPQPHPDHNGGGMRFGPDGMLYISSGDGGTESSGNSQDVSNLLGKILRIDVSDVSTPYAIPAGNMTTPARPEIYAYGLRNPWRFSFDDETGGLFIGDVGQGKWEEVDYLPPNSAGRNFGWPVMEGPECFRPVDVDPQTQQPRCAMAGLQAPIATFSHENIATGGYSITGGFVYRGSAIAGLAGSYLYADYIYGNFWALSASASGQLTTAARLVTPRINPNQQVTGITSFGVDSAGELYVLSAPVEAAPGQGAVYRIVAR